MNPCLSKAFPERSLRFWFFVPGWRPGGRIRKVEGVCLPSDGRMLLGGEGSSLVGKGLYAREAVGSVSRLGGRPWARVDPVRYVPAGVGHSAVLVGLEMPDSEMDRSSPAV